MVIYDTCLDGGVAEQRTPLGRLEVGKARDVRDQDSKRMNNGLNPTASNLPGIVSGQGILGDRMRDDTLGPGWICGPAPSAIVATGATGPEVMVSGATGFIAEGEIPSARPEAGERTFTAEWMIDMETIEVSNARIEDKINLLLNCFGSLSAAIDHPKQQEWYSTDQVAKIFSVKTLTVQDWCRDGRIRAEKQRTGRGRYLTWVISHREIERFRKEGHLPLPRRS